MTKKRFLLALALMLTAVGGAWAQGNTTPVNWNAATKTGSLTVPAGNVTLTVDYYGQYTLDSVPTAEGWQVKVNGSLATVTPYTPGSALGHVDNINETDSVELIPPAELRGTIKAVRLTESVAAPASVLSGALVDGAIIKVNFRWRGTNEGDYVQGVYNAASGTFTASKGGNYWGFDQRAQYKVEKSGDNIIIGACYNNYNYEGMVWTFNTTNDTYTTTNGDIVNIFPTEYGLISVTLNGTDITSQLTAQ